MTRGRARSAINGKVYKELANIIRAELDIEKRQHMADHFATEFRKRLPSFDPAYWEKETGGKVQGFDINTGKFIRDE